ncbi:ATP-binding protein [Paenibacillus sp. GCM10012306]|uniref:HD domain-containing protein n=1 Tax=Paenibacillus sp. GCM10012306 TaxID=3317342 RepID=UPI00361525A7
MIIPKGFMDVLDKDMYLSGIVRSTVSRFDVIIQESKFEFFPEYTKHDTSHVEAVLENAKNLIGESLCLLNVKDITVLILSILVHDLGMHLTFEGFNRFLEKGKEDVIKGIDNLTWEEEWSKYLRESKKWSGKKRQEIFGKKTLLLKEPSKDKNEHSKTDKIFIGEFIRRHHPRMAHEIVLSGFPLVNENNSPFAVDLEFEIKDIIGLISRSHGMDLRSTFSYLLEKHHDCRTPYNIKVIYLMVVLRISDYLHITPDRAPAISLQISSFSSPASILEWDIHQTIKDMNQNHEDPETLFVNARPNNSSEFLKIKSLLKDIQNELDLSWAIIGEVYGRYKELNKLTISIRRIRSNLENKKYTNSLPYLPDKVMFGSEPEAIKLLVSPLYGGKLSYGVRELIQNAVDACRELEYLCKAKSEKSEYKSKIKVSIYQMDSDYFFQIEDNGIGMSAEVIIHYFLKAGASYRNNNDWKTNFTLDGNTQIARSGRFGVGALAAFLLGDQIEVTTKSIDSELGYSFTASLDDVQIEVSNTIDCSVGTKIRIKLNEQSLLELKEQIESDYRSHSSEPAWFAWYLLNKPDIQYEFPDDWGRDGFNKYHTVVSIDNWKQIKIPEFGVVLWTFGGVTSEQFFQSPLLCNGIIIPYGYTSRYPFYNSYPSMNNKPSIMVLDYEGSMPLTLTRDKLGGDGELPFEKELSQSLILDMLAKLLKLKMDTIKLGRDITCFSHPILRSEKMVDVREESLIGEGSLVLSKTGYCLPYIRNIRKLKTNKIVQIWPKSSQELSFNIWSYLEHVMISSYSLSHSNELLKNELYQVSFIHDFRISSKRIYLPKQLGVALIDGEIKMRKDIWGKLEIEKELESMVCIAMNNPPPATIDDSFFESEDGVKVDTLIEIFITPKKFRKYNKRDKEKIAALNKYVEEALDSCFADGVFIPYELKERRGKFPQAFEYLSEYI